MLSMRANKPLFSSFVFMNSVCLLRTQQHSEISMVCMLHLLHLCDYNEEVLKNKKKVMF